MLIERYMAVATRRDISWEVWLDSGVVVSGETRSEAPDSRSVPVLIWGMGKRYYSNVQWVYNISCELYSRV